MGSTRKPRRRLRPEQRRELILDAALEHFARRGYHAAALSEIARDAGTTKAVVYDHFASKRALYDGLVERELRGVIEATLAVEPPAGDRRGVVRAFLDAWFAYVHDRPASRRILFEVVDADLATGVAQRSTQRQAAMVIAAKLREDGAFRPRGRGRDVTVEMAAQMVKTTMNGLADWWFDHPEVARETVVDRASDFVVGGLEALER